MEPRGTLDAEWWQDADGNPVPFGSESGRSVLYPAGAMVPAEVAENLNGRAAEAGAKALDAPPKDKAIRRAPKTK